MMHLADVRACLWVCPHDYL